MSLIDVVLDTKTIEQLRALTEDDSFLAELFDTYTEQTLIQIDRMREAIQQADRITFLRSAHFVAGSSLNVGATAVARACRSAEAAMEAQSAVPDPSQLAAIESEFGRASEAMKRLR